MSDTGSELDPHFHPFPDADQVFSTNVNLHRKHLIPLISIDASCADPSWSGKLHLVSPKESFDGRVGEHCPEFHTKTCKDDILGFQVDKDGKYQFLADFRYFLVERGIKPGSPRYLRGLLNDLVAHYRDVEERFSETREHFNLTGTLNPNPSGQPNRKDDWIIISKEFRSNNAQKLERTVAGKELRYVARATGYSYYANGPSLLHLYFEPVDKIAIIQLDHD